MPDHFGILSYFTPFIKCKKPTFVLSVFVCILVQGPFYCQLLIIIFVTCQLPK